MRGWRSEMCVNGKDGCWGYCMVGTIFELVGCLRIV